MVVAQFPGAGSFEQGVDMSALRSAYAEEKEGRDKGKKETLEPQGMEAMRQNFTYESGGEALPPVVFETDIGNLSLLLTPDEQQSLLLTPNGGTGNEFFMIWFERNMQPGIKETLRKNGIKSLDVLREEDRANLESVVLDRFKAFNGTGYTDEKEQMLKEAEKRATEKLKKNRR